MADVVYWLNAQLQRPPTSHTHPHGTANQTRVLLHQFDKSNEGINAHHLWMDRGGRVNYSMISASLVSRMTNLSCKQATQQAPQYGLFSRHLGGVVLNPKFMRPLCAFPMDVGTIQGRDGSWNDKRCNGRTSCVPGCSVNGRLRWCRPTPSAPDIRYDDWRNWSHKAQWCAWKPTDLDRMLAHRDRLVADGWPKCDDDGQKPCSSDYNEVVLGANFLLDHLPHSILAFFVPAPAEVSGQDEVCKSSVWKPSDRRCATWTRKAHASFLTSFHLTAQMVPLLKLHGDNCNTRFRFELAT